jgi:peptidoglycan/xylan/chitin deacetylase (PgdA/CDA1 family)
MLMDRYDKIGQGSRGARTGALCISIDVELGWGFWDIPFDEYFRLCAERERLIVKRLLTLFARYEIKATWAIVGRLLERGPIPVATRQGEGIWYAPDVVEAIRESSPSQDIGSHSYGHIYFQEYGLEAIRADLEDARRVHDACGLDFTSFVFPRNQVAHVDLLAQAGIRVFRSIDVAWHTRVRRTSTLAGRAANLIDKGLPVPPPVVRPIVHEEGVVEVPSSMQLLDRSGMRRLIRPSIIEAKARLALRHAQQSGDVFHLWFHPSNFYYDTDVQMNLLDRILHAAADMRHRGELEIRAMDSYAKPRTPRTVALTQTA